MYNTLNLFWRTHFADEPVANALVGERDRIVSRLLFWSTVAVGRRRHIHQVRVVRHKDYLF